MNQERVESIVSELGVDHEYKELKFERFRDKNFKNIDYP